MHKLRLAHDRPAYAALRAGTRCVCCSGDAGGLREPYRNPDAPMFSVPVCSACTHHALGGGSVEKIMQGVLALIGGLVIVLGLMWGGVGLATVIGLAFVAAAAIWRAAERAQVARTRARGHHPGLEFEIGDGYTVVATSNVQLVDDLMSLHPSAHVRGDDLPPARAVRLPD
ncbi:MAG TPA: hypothetical protein VMJ10_29155 [Kofleriaceae bacterium]|nr:hypothetical protein [Kofleriaceae bacterium]